MFNLSMETKAQVHRDRQMEQAGLHRLHKTAQAGDPSYQMRFVAMLGGALASATLWLKARQQSLRA